MVRATVILSVVAAFVAVVSAAPKGSLIDVDGGEYIGTGNINAQGALTRVVNADNLAVHDLVQNVDVANDDMDMGSSMGSSMPMRSSGRGSARADISGSGSGCHDGCSGDHGLLNHLLKREEAAPVKAKKMVMRRARKD